MKVIIAEKPSVAKDIASVLGANEKNEGFMSGNGYAVTWAFGHLVELEKPEAYGWGTWALSNLPMLPEPFKLALKDDGGARKQFGVIKGLFKDASEIIVATDAGREGELIFRYIYEYAGIKKPFKRLWISSLTNEAINKGFNDLQPGTKFDSLYYAAKSRSEADWLVGINATQCLTLASGSNTPLSLGRVQTPVLAMVTKRYIDNKNFKPVPYFLLQLVLEKGGKKFKANNEKRFDSKQAAEGAKGIIKSNILCSFSEKKPKKDIQPLLFDLTTLQSDANKKYGFSAQKTLDIMQDLYEKNKVLTYPRTSSRYLSEDIYKELPELFHEISKMSDYTELIEVLVDYRNLPKRSVDDSKVTDHHAIIPTGKKAQGLSGDEQKIFDMVVRRTIAAFSPVCEKEITTYKFQESDQVFTCSGTIINVAGWRLAETEEKEEKETDENEESQDLPIVSQGENVKVDSSNVLEKKTTPKPLLTESSLLKLMESAGKEIEDAELSKAIKDCGIGTPATRAAIIETLLKRTYIEREKKSLVPTQLGMSVYDLVKDYPIANVEMTGEWEFKINKIADGSYDNEKFLDEIKSFSSELVEILKQTGSTIDLKKKKCPKCKEGELYEGEKFISCKRKEECGFIIFRVINKKKVSDSQILKLLEKGKTDVIKGFHKKDSEKTFDVALKFDENFKVVFDFPDRAASGTAVAAVSLGKCPKCSEGEVTEWDKGFSCSKKRETQCSFVIWKEISHKKITAADVKELLANGKTGLIKGYKGKSAKFDAFLKIDNDKKVVFEFPPKK